MKESFTIDDLLNLVPTITIHDGAKIMEVIDDLQAKLDQANAEIATLKTVSLTKPVRTNSLSGTQILIMRKRIHDLILSRRAIAFLDRHNVDFVWQLVEQTEPSILKAMREMKNYSRKSLNEVKDFLLEQDLFLGMTFDRTIFMNPSSENASVPTRDDLHPSSHLHAP